MPLQSDLSSIPLPSLAETGKASRKSAKEMLQDALKITQKAKKVSKAAEASSKSNQPKTNESSDSSGKSSQSIVDELFKDFIAQKFNKVPYDQTSTETGGKRENSVDEISKILDMEIFSIQNNSEGKDVEKNLSLSKKAENKVHGSKRHHKMKSAKRSRSDKSVTEALPEKKAKKHNHSVSPKCLTVAADKSLNSDANKSKEAEPSQATTATNQKEEVSDAKDKQTPSQALSTASPDISKVELPLASMLEHKVQHLMQSQPDGGEQFSQKESQGEGKENAEDKTKPAPGLMLPMPLAKKLAIPKQLGLKLTTTSLSLIKSTDRVDQDGRVWEEGEVLSSHSENEEAESESELDGYPSETGSINSNAEDWRDQVHKSKKKHKHKHKKKKKKSSGKGKEKQNKSSSEKSSSQDSKHGKHSEKRSSGDRKGRDKSRSKSREHNRRSRDARNSKETDSHKRLRSRSKSPKSNRSPRRSRSRSITPKRSRYDEWDARHYSSKSKRRSHSRSRSRGRSSENNKRSSSSGRHDERKKKETGEQRLQIDKAKLRRIAIANALVNMKAGQGPQVEVPVVKSEGKTVQELTEFCKRIADKGKDGEGSEVSDSSEEEVHQNSDDEETLIHHPFKIKEPTSTGIVMNIRNSKQLPVLTPLEKQAQKANLRLTFPVSSGSHHRANESEWVPVERPNPAPARPAAPAPVSSQQAKPTAVAEPVAQIPVPQEPAKSDSIFPDPVEVQKIDIGTIISERLQAVRKLQQNPYDVQALSSMHKAQEQASKWATSKHLPGQFMGSTGAKVLSQSELIGDKKHQAWAKKTQLSQAAPVTGGIGMFLLQKMGWKHGEGLGKNNEGSKEPLLLDVKVDRKGLSAAVEHPQRKEGTVTRAKDLSNKHPVSALMELCNRRKWGPPLFTVVDESGPDHKKNFLFKVKVNNIEYQPTVPSSNKKTAKAQCAGVCLQELGLIPRDAPLNI